MMFRKCLGTYLLDLIYFLLLSEQEQRPQEQEPPVAAKMGTFEMAKAMKNSEVYLFVSKKYSVADWSKFVEENQDLMHRIVLASIKGIERNRGVLINCPTVSLLEFQWLFQK